MERKNLWLIAFVTFLSLLITFGTGGILVATRTLDITQDKAIYFNQEYESDFDVYVNHKDDAEILEFDSVKDDQWEAVITWDEKEGKVDVSENGLILDSDDEETDYYYFLWWEEEDLTLTDNINGIGLGVIAEEKERKIKDPLGIFLNENETYIAECVESFVYLRGTFATQASYRYIVRRESDDRVVGDAIIDMTSGMPFEMNLYEVNKTSVHIELKDTTFIISRNRYRLLTAASIVCPALLGALYYYLKKKREMEQEELNDIMFLAVLGLFGVWLDQFLDFWYTYTVLLPVILVIHFVPIILILVFKREFWHYSVIPLVEMVVYYCLTFFNMGIYVLWLFYGNFVLFLALWCQYYSLSEKVD